MVSLKRRRSMPESVSENGWCRYRFDEMAVMVNDRIDDPSEAEVEFYVGLEHLDSESLAIRRWGSPTDVEATKLRFRAGDIIFGRRRVYQRKLAVAHFDGICSAHAMVLRAKAEVALPGFLPFFMQSDLFMERAKEISVGSLSPTINWKTLAKETFALPPLEEQRRIAEVLGAAMRTAQRLDEAAASLQATADSLLIRYLQGAHLGGFVYDERFGRYSSHLTLTSIGELLTATQYGLSEPSESGGRYRMLRMMNLSDGLATDENLCSLDLSDEEFFRYRLEHGDVLFNRTNSHDLVGRTGVYRLEGDHVFASYLVRLKTDANVLLPDYLCAFLNAPVGRRQIMRFATRGVSQANVNVSNLRSMLIPLPPINYQQTVVEYIEELRSARRSQQRRSSEAKTLAARIANEFLGAA
jgi:type I restriction enzyme S subunit